MKLSIRLAVAILLVLAGWVAGRAQTPKGDFIITIDAPGYGRTSVECLEGCTALVGGRDIGLYQEGRRTGRTATTYGFGCGAKRCQATFHGFIKK